MPEREEPREELYSSEEDYQRKTQSRSELATYWADEISAADRVYSDWASKFKISDLYEAYEGFQWEETQEPGYVMNMIYSTIEVKLPSLIFNNPQFNLRPRPYGEDFDMDVAMRTTQAKQDALNYVCSREEFGLTEKHELAILDAFFGFGVLETRFSKDELCNPFLAGARSNSLNSIYCKHIPFDHFRVSARANWDLSSGKWLGYYEFVDIERVKKYKSNFSIPTSRANIGIPNGKLILGEMSDSVCAPEGQVKIWFIWDLYKMRHIVYSPDSDLGDKLLIYQGFNHCPLSTLRLGKRRKGWYPLPPVFNWISPQLEINDIRQAQRNHRRRFARKYVVKEGGMEQEEIDKFINGPDGTVAVEKLQNSIRAVEDAQLNSANQQSLVISYSDMDRITGTSSEQRGVLGATGSDRTTATQAGIIDKRSQIRESKDFMRVGNFMNSFARNVLIALKEIKDPFWALTSNNNETLMGAVQPNTQQWRMIPPLVFLDNEEEDVQINVNSISPIYAQEDKRNFFEFLAIITQYEILAFSPALLREAAYRCGYKNDAVLGQFQEMAQLAAITRMSALKGQAMSAMLPTEGTQPTESGTLPQKQVDVSTPPDGQSIMNMVFNRGGIQGG